VTGPLGVHAGMGQRRCEEDRADKAGPRRSEREREGAGERFEALTGGARGTERVGRVCEGSWHRQVGPTGQREGGRACECEMALTGGTRLSGGAGAA
jgi:hypothetical protein